MFLFPAPVVVVKFMHKEGYNLECIMLLGTSLREG